MKNWRVLSLVLVCVIAIVIWQLLPAPTARGQGMKLPPGITLKEKTFDVTGMPGVKKLTWNRLEVKPGAKWKDVNMGPKVWDLCYQLSGTMTTKDTNGKMSNVPPGTVYTIPPNTPIPLITNTGHVTAVDIFWEIETQ